MSYNIPPDDAEMFKFVSHNNLKKQPRTDSSSEWKQREKKARYRGNYYTLNLQGINAKLYNMKNDEKLRPFFKDLLDLECEMGKYQKMKDLRIPYDDIQKWMDPRFDNYDEENTRNFLRHAIVERMERVNAEIRKLLKINFKFLFTEHVRILNDIATKYHEMLNELPYTNRELSMREESKRAHQWGVLDTSHNEESDENENETI